MQGSCRVAPLLLCPTAAALAAPGSLELTIASVPFHLVLKLRVRMRGYDIGILAKAAEQIKLIARMTGAKIIGPVMLPTKKKIYCVLRSPHVNKDAREHFEIRIHNRLIDVTGLSSQTVQALLEWVPPSGLEVETSIV